MKKVILTLVAGCALCSTAMAAQTTSQVIRSLSQAQQFCAPVKNITFNANSRSHREGFLSGSNANGVNFVSFNDVRNSRAIAPSINVIAPHGALAQSLKLYKNPKLRGYGVRLPNGVINCLYQYKANTGARVTVMMVGNGRPQA